MMTFSDMIYLRQFNRTLQFRARATGFYCNFPLKLMSALKVDGIQEKNAIREYFLEFYLRTDSNHLQSDEPCGVLIHLDSLGLNLDSCKGALPDTR